MAAGKDLGDCRILICPPLYISTLTPILRQTTPSTSPAIAGHFLLKFYYAGCKLFGENIPIYYSDVKLPETHTATHTYIITLILAPTHHYSARPPSRRRHRVSIRFAHGFARRGVVQRQNSGFISRRSGFESRPRNHRDFPDARLSKTT